MVNSFCAPWDKSCTKAVLMISGLYDCLLNKVSNKGRKPNLPESFSLMLLDRSIDFGFVFCLAFQI